MGWFCMMRFPILFPCTHSDGCWNFAALGYVGKFWRAVKWLPCPLYYAWEYGLRHCFIVFSRIRGFLGAFFVASWNRILGVLGLFDNEIFIASRVSTHKFKQQIACDWIDLFRTLNWQWELQTTIRNLHQLQTWHWRFFSWYREMILPSSIILTQPHKWLNYFSWCDQTFTSITFRLLSVCSPLPPGGLGQLQSKLVSDPETWRSWWSQSTRAKESLWNLQAGRGPGVNESDCWSLMAWESPFKVISWRRNHISSHVYSRSHIKVDN